MPTHVPSGSSASPPRPPWWPASASCPGRRPPPRRRLAPPVARAGHRRARRPRRARHRRPDRRPRRSRPSPASPARCAGTPSARRPPSPRSRAPSVPRPRATRPPPPSRGWSRTRRCSGSRAAQLAGPRPSSTTRSSPAAPPARCSSARTSAVPPPRSTAWSPSASATAPIQYVSSSLVRTTATSVPAATLSPTAAWVKAAANIGRDVSLGSLSKVTDSLGWTRFTVPGFAQEQQVRLRSLAYADGTVRPVFEANVVDVKGGAATAYTVLVDAVSGKILVRQNKVDESSDAFQFQGAVTATDVRAQAPVRADRRQHQADRGDRRRGGHHQRHRRQDLQRRPARCSPRATPPPAPRSRRTAPSRSPRASTRCRSARSTDPTVPFAGAGDYAAGVDHQRQRPPRPAPRWASRSGATSPRTRRSTGPRRPRRRTR